MNSLIMVIVLVAAAAITEGGYISGGLGSTGILGSGLGYLSNPVISANGIPLGASLLSSHGSVLSAHSVVVPNSRVAPAGVIVPAGHGLEGQYIPDLHEKLHDDGTYKPYVYGA